MENLDKKKRSKDGEFSDDNLLLDPWVVLHRWFCKKKLIEISYSFYFFEQESMLSLEIELIQFK